VKGRAGQATSTVRLVRERRVKKPGIARIPGWEMALVLMRLSYEAICYTGGWRVSVISAKGLSLVTTLRLEVQEQDDVAGQHKRREHNHPAQRFETAALLGIL